MKLSANLQYSLPFPFRKRPTNSISGMYSFQRQHAWNSFQSVAKNLKYEKLETVFVIVRGNYKRLESIGFSGRSTWKFASILDTGSGPSFIKKDVIHESV